MSLYFQLQYYQVQHYLAYVNGMVRHKEAARERKASEKVEEEKMLEEMEKSIKENLEEEAEEKWDKGQLEDGDEDQMEEEVDEVEMVNEEVIQVKESEKVRDRVGSLESGYGSGKVEVIQKTSL